MIFAKKSKFHDAGGPDTVVSPYVGQIFGHVTPDFEIKICLANFATVCNFTHNFGH